MNLRSRIMFRIAGLLILLITAVCVAASVFAIKEARRDTMQRFEAQLEFVSHETERLVLCDDRMGLKVILDGMVQHEPVIAYAFVERDGRPWLHTFREGVPRGLLCSVCGPDLPPGLRQVQDERGQVLYDLHTEVGQTGACLHLGLSRSRIDGAAWSLIGVIVRLGLGASALGLWAAVLTAGLTTREVNRITGALESEIGERKEAEQKLLAAREQVEQINRRLERAIEGANRMAQAAEAANISKSEFLANMSHEIRTPMTAILGYAELLAAGCPGGCEFGRGEAREYLETIYRNGRHLLTIINDILDLSKAEAGRMTIERIACSTVQVVAEVASLMGAQARGKGLSLAIECDGPIPETVRTDPTRLRQILLNLVGNAVKFTETGGVRLVTRMVDVDSKDGAESAEPKLQFAVIDTGVGMTPETMERLFQPFSQADNSTTRKFGGTGLGLAISKRLAQTLGGDIAVASEPGKGSTFTLTVAAGPLEGVRVIQECRCSAICDDPPPPGRQGDAAGLASSATSQADPEKLDCRILLAEDGPDNQRLIAHILRKAGAEVTIVENGQQAVEAALAARDAGRPFEVILMDMQMPVLDGYAATRLLRRKDYAGPIVALTAHTMDGDRAKCLEAGCDDYASKPVDRNGLLEVVRRHMTGAPAGVAG